MTGIDLPPGLWHTIVCLEKDSVLYETKQGPFTPIPEEDMAPWAPEEGSAKATGYEQRLAASAHGFHSALSRTRDDG